MANGADRNRTWVLAGLAGLVVVAAVVAAALALGGDGDDVATVDTTTTTAGAEPPSTTTTTAEPTTTTSSSSTTSSIDPAGGEEIQSQAVWPWFSSDVRYDDPQEAARGFAEEYVGFTDPVVGEFQAGDSRSGEVEVRPRDDGPVTTVLVRQLGDDGSWWVLGSHTADIQLDEPEAGAEISSPVVLRGQALAFEGTVDVAVREDGSEEPLGRGFVTGSGGPEPGPFEGTVEFSAADGGWGALVLTTMGGEDPVVWQATVVRVRFADAA